jgi:hypothetical protein
MKVMFGALCVAVSTMYSLLAVGDSPTPHVPDAARTTIVAELFTSEGCSSCPPADALLHELVSTQPLDGIEIVAMSNHVDYWNSLGWRDPFSSALFSERQSTYAAVFRSNNIYTPQLVVDGALECVASDRAAVQKTILQAAKTPKGTVSVAVRGAGTSAAITIRAAVPIGVRLDQSADIVVAVLEDGLTSRVERGENHGRTLSHDAVVRRLTTAGHLAPEKREADLSTTVKLDPGWKPGALRIVAFVQESTSRRIVAAGSSPIVSSQLSSQ